MGCHYTKKKRKNGRASRAANFRSAALWQCRTVIRPLCLCAAIAKTTLACQGVKQGHDRISLPHARVGLACAKVAGLLCAWWPVGKKKGGGHCVSRDRRMKIAESVASWKICLFTLYSCWQTVLIRIIVWILAPEKARRRKAWNNFLSGRNFFLHFCLIDGHFYNADFCSFQPSRPFCWKAPGALHFLNRFYPPNKMLALQSRSGWQRATRPSTNVPRVTTDNTTMTTGPPTCCGRILSTRAHHWL